MTSAKKYAVAAVGTNVLDIQITGDDALLAQEGLKKGVTNPIGNDTFQRLTQGKSPEKFIGGAGCNVTAGIAAHGGKAALIGKVANDENGRFFTARAAAHGIDYTPVLTTDPAVPTTCVLVITTPDKERSFAFIDGAANDLTPEDVDTSLISNAAITYLDSYLWNTENGRDAVLYAADAAKAAGSQVAIALNDFNIVASNREAFLALAQSHGDILVGDQREFATLLGTSSLEETIKAVQQLGCLASITAGKDGAYIVEPTAVTHVPCQKIAKIVDTNGAGDQFAAGFLYGVATGLSAAEAGHTGSVWASQIIQHMGAEPRLAPQNKPASAAPKRRLG